MAESLKIAFKKKIIIIIPRYLWACRACKNLSVPQSPHGEMGIRKCSLRCQAGTEPGSASYPNCALLAWLLCGSECPCETLGHLAGHPGMRTGQSHGSSQVGIHLSPHLISTPTRRPQPRRWIDQAASNLQGFKTQPHTVTGRDWHFPQPLEISCLALPGSGDIHFLPPPTTFTGLHRSPGSNILS